MQLFFATTVLATLVAFPLSAAGNEPAQRLDESADVLSEVMSAPASTMGVYAGTPILLARSGA